MKKMLTLCALLCFPIYVSLPLTESFSSNEINKQGEELNKNLLNKNVESYSLLNSSNDSTSYDINYNVKKVSAYLHPKKGPWPASDVDKNATDETDTYNIDFDKYIFMKDEVLKKLTFSFDLSNSYIVSDEDAENPNYRRYLPNPIMKNISLPSINSAKTINCDGETKYENDNDYIEGKWSVYLKNVNNTSLQVKVTMNTHAHDGGSRAQNTAGLGHGVLFFNKVTINVPYSLETIRNNITDAFKNYTLSYISSTATTVLGNAGATNRSEIEAILRKQLSGHIPLGLYDSLNPQMWFTETPEKFINFKMVFVDPNTKKNNDASLWTWNVPIKFSLSPDYWQKSFWSRLSLSPGKISDASGIKLVDDTLEVIDAGQGVDNGYDGGHILYHTTTSLSFFELKNNDNDDDYDSLSVNGIKLNGIDGQYQYNLIDNSVGDATGKKTSDYITTFLVRT